MKKFNGKAIYNPSGAAREYSYWGCNLVVGCSNGCEYCYCKKGILKGVMGMDRPQLKKCLVNEITAFEIFKKEVLINKTELQKHGLFFSFTTDPMLTEFWDLTWKAIMFCNAHEIPVKVLTKLAGWVESTLNYFNHSNSDNADREWRKLIAFGFTLTGYDELERGASTNQERIEGMKLLHEAGFKTFASIEPIIDFERSYEMIRLSLGYCDLYKIGLMSGQKVDKHFYNKLRSFNLQVVNTLAHFPAKVYWKESIQKHFGIFPDARCNVTRKYNIFTGGDECLEECTSCNKEFDIEDMESDSAGNWFCPECWKVLEPVMRTEYEESLKNG